MSKWICYFRTAPKVGDPGEGGVLSPVDFAQPERVELVMLIVAVVVVEVVDPPEVLLLAVGDFAQQ